MIKGTEKAPAIRFRGFTDDWEQRKLGEITKANSFKQYIAEGTLDGTYEVIQQGDTPVVGYADGKPFEDYEDVSLFGDHTLSLYKPKSPFFVASDGIKILSPSISINGLFYYYLLMRYKPHSEGYKRHYTILKSCEALYPTESEEQKKIGEYFANLDNLITLHQHKLEQQKKLKAFFLKNMFPEEGETVPRIRFKEFTGDWEQRKLGDEAIEIIAGGDVDKSKLLERGRYPVIANALTNDGIVGYYENDYRIKAPAVTVTGRGDVGHAQARKFNFTPVVRLLAVYSNHDVDFLAEAINQCDVVLESTGVPQLTVPKLANYCICFPPTFDEEVQIGAYLYKLDHLITLQQHKIDQLQDVKKFMLQNLFV